MHLIDAKSNNRIITSLFHFASTLATQNEIKKNQNVIIITLLQNVLQQRTLPLSHAPQYILSLFAEINSSFLQAVWTQIRLLMYNVGAFWFWSTLFVPILT